MYADGASLACVAATVAAPEGNFKSAAGQRWTPALHTHALARSGTAAPLRNLAGPARLLGEEGMLHVGGKEVLDAGNLADKTEENSTAARGDRNRGKMLVRRGGGAAGSPRWSSR